MLEDLYSCVRSYSLPPFCCSALYGHQVVFVSVYQGFTPRRDHNRRFLFLYDRRSRDCISMMQPVSVITRGLDEPVLFLPVDLSLPFKRAGRISTVRGHLGQRKGAPFANHSQLEERYSERQARVCMAVELPVPYMKRCNQLLECCPVERASERRFRKEYINVAQLTIIPHFCTAHQRHILLAYPLACENRLRLLFHCMVQRLHLISVGLVVTPSEEAIQDVSIIGDHTAEGRKNRRVFGYIHLFHTEPLGHGNSVYRTSPASHHQYKIARVITFLHNAQKDTLTHNSLFQGSHGIGCLDRIHA